MQILFLNKVFSNKRHRICCNNNNNNNNNKIKSIVLPKLHMSYNQSSREKQNMHKKCFNYVIVNLKSACNNNRINSGIELFSTLIILFYFINIIK